MAVYALSLIPICKIASWDFCINENGEPIFIEVNLKYPSTMLTQILYGSIFGDRTEKL